VTKSSPHAVGVVDVGLERDAFLYVSDVIEDLEEFDNSDSTEDLSLEDVLNSAPRRRLRICCAKGRDRGAGSKDTIAARARASPAHHAARAFFVYMRRSTTLGLRRIENEANARD